MVKMGTLESPLEALALNYLSYGFLAAVNSVWAWVAVVTAAVSFWRIRALSSAPELRTRSKDAASTSSSSAPPKESEMTAVATLVERPSRAAVVGGGVQVEREGMTKTKFTLCYEAEEFWKDEGSESDEDNGIESSASVTEKLGWFYEDWERMAVVRMGDLGWYRWQDTTVLDGSVVRLWGRLAMASVAEGGVVL